jgi:APA family basic amino acid/polyamine antiporter
MPLWQTKDIAGLRAHTAAYDDVAPPPFRRVLGPLDLGALGVGAMVGVGMFVLTGTAAAQYAGPGVVISFIIAGIGSLLVALCYAELASMIPVAGGAYTYSYAAFGEPLGWVIGWNLLLQYCLGAATVAVAFSSYSTGLLHTAGVVVPPSLLRAPVELHEASGYPARGIANLPALALPLILSIVIAAGIRPAVLLTRALVAVKVVVVLVIIGFGFMFASPANWQPFIPPATDGFGRYGWSGVVRGAGALFLAFVGFDAIPLASQEARNPQRHVGVAMLGAVALCGVLYVLMALVMTGLTRYPNLNAPMPLITAVSAPGTALGWLVPFINGTILIALGSVALVMLTMHPRILFAMARDRLLPARLARVHPRFGTPTVATAVTAVVAALFAGFFPISWLLDAVAMSALFVSAAVCAALVVVRYRYPNVQRPFRVAAVPLVSFAAIVSCIGAMIILGRDTAVRFVLLNAVGIVLYVVVLVSRVRTRASVTH